MLGLFIPQVLLAATYSALGDGSSLKRILYSMLVVTVFTCLVQAFTRWWFATSVNEGRPTVLLLVIFYFFLLQIPIWVFRVCSGWRISLGTRTVPERMGFSIMHMIGWSTFLSVPLCLIASLSELEGGGVEVIVYITLLMLALAAMVLRAIYISLVLENPWRCIAAAFLWIAAVTAQISCIWTLGGSYAEAVTVLTANGVGLLLILCCLRAARSVGYRLLPFTENRPRPPGITFQGHDT